MSVGLNSGFSSPVSLGWTYASPNFDGRQLFSPLGGFLLNTANDTSNVAVADSTTAYDGSGSSINYNPLSLGSYGGTNLQFINNRVDNILNNITNNNNNNNYGTFSVNGSNGVGSSLGVSVPLSNSTISNTYNTNNYVTNIKKISEIIKQITQSINLSGTGVVITQDGRLSTLPYVTQTVVTDFQVDTSAKQLQVKTRSATLITSADESDWVSKHTGTASCPS